MSSGAIMMTLVILVIAGITAYIVGTMIRSISNELNTNGSPSSCSCSRSRSWPRS
jgi:hypothetical protein